MKHRNETKRQIEKRILKALASKKRKTARELYYSLGVGAVELDKTLYNLERLGVVERSEKGVYRWQRRQFRTCQFAV